ncbi:MULTISPECIES: sigma-54 dependent transcriptional regulator [unclassified Halomonas]|nr:MULTISPECIES: sigma-54 dependent transcriptional regulator [unclassified Halomonas]MDT0501057.1 sigma-54 dependent transcriptional regulator [Halomonas sp. PAR7]MDT0513248.1 sigma-54 dependent transcriptional regulator [Halomonas sp. LES1]
MDKSRHVLMIGDQRLTASAALSLKQYSWQFQRTSCLVEAKRLLLTSPPPLGIVVMEPSYTMPSLELERLLSLVPCTLWVALLGADDLQEYQARAFIARHCHAYLILPLNPDKANHVLESSLTISEVLATHSGACDFSAAPGCKGEMIGRSHAIHKLLKDIEKIALVDAPVLITGESGTGKELTARLIHEHSPRHGGPFNAINCGALPAGLIQSELFGHEKGAFTGAGKCKVGIIESASGGTLFLDEIGDLPMELQVNLLRFLEDHRIQRLGSLHEIAVDVRILAATHVDLEQAIRSGDFREDLYHRINVLQARMPPLRERPEDIEALATHYFQKFRTESPYRVRGFNHDSLVTMRQHHWPGNVRELVNRIRRAMVMCEERLITPDDLGLERRKNVIRTRPSLEDIRNCAEREAIAAALARNRNHALHAAQDLGISRATLYRLIDKHCVPRPLDSRA